VARVPVYDGPQVRSNALQPPQQHEVDVSSGMRATGQALVDAGALADKVVRRDAESEANRIDSEITSGWLQWDAENRRKYQGQNIDEYGVEANKWWDKAREAHGKNLNPMVQQAIGQQLARKRAQALASVAGHIGTEKERFADDAGEKAALTAIEFGVDTGDTAGAGNQVRKIVAERGARKGWTTEMVQADQQRLLGTLHLSVITTMAEKDPTKARAYYDANKGEIPTTAQSRVEQVLKAEGDNQFAQQFAAQHAAKPLAEQLKAASEIADGERRKKTLSEIHNNATLVKAAQAEKEAAASDEAWQLVGKGKRVPETVLMRMDGKSRVQLQEHVADRARIAADRAEGKPPKTDWGTYIELRTRLAAGEKVDLRPFAGTKIAGPQLEQLLDIQTRVKDPKKAPEVATSEQQMSAYAKVLNLQHDKLGQFQSAAYDRFNMHLQAKGKEPTYEERQTILDQLTMDVVTKPGMIWDSKAPAYQAPKAVRDKALPLPTADKFTAGKVYTDKNGARAKYLGNNQWEPVQ
jgi:hypothetical protein